MFFADWLVDEDVFVGSDRSVSVGVEFNGSVSVNLSSAFGIFVIPELKIKGSVPIHWPEDPVGHHRLGSEGSQI